MPRSIRAEKKIAEQFKGCCSDHDNACMLIYLVFSVFFVRFLWIGNVFLNVFGWGLYTVCGMWATESFALGERRCVSCTSVGQGKGPLIQT